MKYVALDIETIKPFSLDEDWRDKRPLGIACVGLATPDETWLIANQDYGQPVCQEDLASLVRNLVDLTAGEYTLVTWNGLGFDLQILGEEAGSVHQCQHLARSHVDMMFQVHCVKGFPISLAAALAGTGVGEKTEGVTGAETAMLWEAGEYQKVYEYCMHDTKLTRELAEYGERNHRLQWISQRGRRQQVNLPTGWHPVELMRRFPEPDTSWMTRPIPRSQFTDWLG